MVNRLRSDNRREFANQQFRDYLADKEIVHEFSVSHSLEQNGTVERHNLILIVKVRTMMAWAKVPNTYWGWVLEIASVVKNLSISKLLDYHTPYSIAYKTRNYSIDYLRTWGCFCTYLDYYHAQIASKFQFKFFPIVFICYAINTNNYIVYYPYHHRTVVITNVKFYEDYPAGYYFHDIFQLSLTLLQFPILLLPMLTKKTQI